MSCRSNTPMQTSGYLTWEYTAPHSRPPAVFPPEISPAKPMSDILSNTRCSTGYPLRNGQYRRSDPRESAPESRRRRAGSSQGGHTFLTFTSYLPLPLLHPADTLCTNADMITISFPWTLRVFLLSQLRSI